MSIARKRRLWRLFGNFLRPFTAAHLFGRSQINMWLKTATLLLTVSALQAQVISFGMRKIAYSSNQFGLDLLRASDKSESRLAFCPFCISSSIVMLMMGTAGQSPMSASLRHALYLYGMSDSEINFAYHDMMNHLGVNLPSSKSNVNGRHYNQVGHVAPSSHLSSFANNHQPLLPANPVWMSQSVGSFHHNPYNSLGTSAWNGLHSSHSVERPTAAYTQLNYPLSYYGIYEKAALEQHPLVTG